MSDRAVSVGVLRLRGAPPCEVCGRGSLLVRAVGVSGDSPTTEDNCSAVANSSLVPGALVGRSLQVPCRVLRTSGTAFLSAARLTSHFARVSMTA